MTNKIFITGSNKIDKLEYAKRIVSRNDDLSISQSFTNDEKYKDSVTDDYIYYLDLKDIDLSYKNNAFLFINAKDNIYTGITFDSFYNEDIFCLDIKEFNSIPDYIFSQNDILVIWLDTKIKGRDKSNDDDIFATKHLIEKIDKLNVMYFLDEDPDKVVDKIIEYIEGNEETKQTLLEENY